MSRRANLDSASTAFLRCAVLGYGRKDRAIEKGRAGDLHRDVGYGDTKVILGFAGDGGRASFLFPAKIVI